MSEVLHSEKHHSILSASHQADEQLELLVYWRSVVKRKWSILGLAAAMTLLATVVVFMMTPIYRSTVTILIEQNKTKVVSIEDVYSGIGQGKEYIQTQSEIIKSLSLAKVVVDKLKLTKHPAFDPRVNTSWLHSTLAAVGVSGKELTEAEVREAVAANLIDHLIVEPVKLSQLIKVSYDSSDSELSAKIANAVAEAFVESDMEAKFQMTQRASNWLNEHLAGLKVDLQKSEQALQEYRDREHIVDAGNLELSGASNQLQGLLASLVNARMNRAQAESQYKQVKNAGDSLESLPVVQKDPLAAKLKEVVAEKERKVSELANRYGKEHVKMIQAQADLDQARDGLRRHVDVVVAGLQREYEVARANEAALAGAVAEAKGTIQGANKKGFELSALERDVATNKQIYETFLNRFKETTATGDSGALVGRVIDPAMPATSPVKPKKAMVIAIAFVLGTLFGVAVALLLDRLDNTVRTTEDAELKLGQPILSTLPLLEGNNDQHMGRYYLDEPRSVFAESVRTARTGVLLSAIDCPNKVLVVTSSVPGEGKTTVSSNLALSHSQTKRVLLIDADMRRPSVAKVMNLDLAKLGLSALVTGTAMLEECIQTIEGATLHVVTAGSIPPNPLELLLSHKFEELLKSLSEQYDMVIIDSPPVQLVSDAVVLSTLATGVVFVVKADSTPYQLAKRCIKTLLEAEATLFGVTLNQLDFRKAESYYGAYTGYGKYGYDGYYTKET
ncbi:polysaccharide biosynthesis tyrosine autokinase [Ferriphaselus sp. R-1]|uniref:GumC family protein n=1 Tax=Ferriphaselus sp. R-1 TaxID=1485544 RepID=UPI00068E29CF|nr:polysaccharide biosynthesis tyrosine autokinase [Ferriphaselus sp. R-1]